MPGFAFKRMSALDFFLYFAAYLKRLFLFAYAKNRELINLSIQRLIIAISLFRRCFVFQFVTESLKIVFSFEISKRSKIK